MRRWLIRSVLPLLLCCMPLLGAALVLASLPPQARLFYFEHLTPLDYLILLLGGVLFFVQLLLAWSAMRWRGRGFNEKADPWLTHLGSAAEWFPLLGLIGTVTSIMVTFASIGSKQMTQAQIMTAFAPAITATCSGLLMALFNILPTWIVLLGRDLILGMAGGARPEAVAGQAVANGAASAPTEPARR
jgi:hypothetical protein